MVLLVPNKLLSKQLNHIPNQRRIAGKRIQESSHVYVLLLCITHTFSHVGTADRRRTCCSVSPPLLCPPALVTL